MKLSDLKTLHEKGFALIYLRPKSKRPFEKKWTKSKPKSWAELRDSFEKSYNAGVRLGEPSKLISGNYLGAIDCDVKAQSRKARREMNDALRALKLDLTTTPIVMSGRGNGSKHIYVQTVTPMVSMKYATSQETVKVLMLGETHPHSKREMKELSEAERTSGYRIRPAWEISFMGTGQQTVLPPSIHPDTGMKYAWASPLMVKRLPLFNPSKFVSQIERVERDVPKLDFQAVDVNLYDTKLPVKFIKMIEEGKNVEDRSAALFSCTLAMCRVGFTDNEILSVLSDEANWISEAAYIHTASRDRGVAVHWLNKYTLAKARFETDIARRFEQKVDVTPLGEFEALEQEEELQALQEQVLPDLDGQRKPKQTVRNVVHILEKFLGGGLVGLDEFSNRVVYLKDTPYGGKRGRELTDQDDRELSHYVAEHYRFEPALDHCFRAHAIIAHRYRFHPVRRYLERLEWDRVPRLDGWLREAFKAHGPKLYLNAVSRKTMVAAVKRVMEPGCKYDYALVLEGFQGKGKSTALSILAGAPWFTDSLGDIYQKDVVDQMTGKWVIELAELSSFKGKDNEYLKAFISRQVDRVRPPYGRRSQDFPRQSIFIGSTNSSEYLTDETGNRRYWPVKVDAVDRKWLRKNRDQLWAEALHYYREGEKLYLPKEIEELARAEQDKRFEVDEWEHPIKELLAKKENDSKTGELRITSTEVWNELNGFTGHSAGGPPTMDVKRIGRIMHRLGFDRKPYRLDSHLVKGWVKHV